MNFTDESNYEIFGLVDGLHPKHPCDKILLEKDICLSECRRRARESDWWITSDLRQIYEEETNKLSDETKRMMKKFESIEGSLRNHRSILRPPLPPTMMDFFAFFNEPFRPNVNNEDKDDHDNHLAQLVNFTTTNRGEKFLHEFALVDEHGAIFILAAQADLDRLRSRKRWFIDGTFSIVPQSKLLFVSY